MLCYAPPVAYTTTTLFIDGRSGHRSTHAPEPGMDGVVGLIHRRNLYVLSWYAIMHDLYCRIQRLQHFRGCRKRKRSIRRQRRTFLEVTKYLTGQKFLRHFRTTRRGFGVLLSLVRGDIEKNEAMAALSSGGAIAADVRLAITLRMLAGASYLDCALSFSVEESTVTRVFYQTVRALNKVLKIRCKYDDIRELQKLSFDFSASRRCPLHGCVGAIDGIVIAIRRPRLDECNNPSSYWN